MTSSASLEPLPLAASDSPGEAAVAPAQDKDGYGQILKSSALVGGSSVLNIVIGIARTKAMAVLLGPAGIGLTGLYTSVVDITQALAGMGISSSGVRQIAEAAGSGDHERIARTAIMLRRTALLLGILGAVLLFVFSRPISTLTFGTSANATALCLLSMAVFFRAVSGGQGALLQGTRRIADLARMNVWGAFLGMLSSVVLIYFMRENGIVPALVSVAAMTMLTSWWYSRKVSVPRVSLAPRQMGQEAAGLLKLGFAFMSSGFLTMGAAYAVRILLVREIGFEATGSYQAAWTLGVLYVSFILQAMGADFYPRLTARIHDHAACNRIVNEQTHVGLLLAGPGVMATLTFAPVVIAVFYSGKFDGAAGILRWISLGAMLQVVSWPMGFIVLAKARQNLFLFSDAAWAIFYVWMAWICIRRFGSAGAGMAFFGSYFFHALVTYPIVRRLSGFRWSPENRKLGVIFAILIAFTFAAVAVLPLMWAVSLGCVLSLGSGLYAMRTLLRLVPNHGISRLMQRLVPRSLSRWFESGREDFAA